MLQKELGIFVLIGKTMNQKFEYENMRRVQYEGGATFVPVCPVCGRFVKADDTIFVNDEVGLRDTPTATCSKCGRIRMPFEGFI